MCFGSLAQRTFGNRRLLTSILDSVPAKEIFFKVTVKGAVGAGDSFSAGFLYAYDQTGGDIFASLRFAVTLAEFVVSRTGALPEYDQTILNTVLVLG